MPHPHPLCAHTFPAKDDMAFLDEGYGDSSPPTPGVPPSGDFCVLPITLGVFLSGQGPRY